MNQDELKRVSDKIWSDLFCIKNENLTQKEQINIIEKEIIKISTEQRLVGRRQVIKHIEIELNSL